MSPFEQKPLGDFYLPSMKPPETSLAEFAPGGPPLMKVMSKQHIGKMKKKGNFHSHSQITTIRSKKASKQMDES